MQIISCLGCNEFCSCIGSRSKEQLTHDEHCDSTNATEQDLSDLFGCNPLILLVASVSVPSAHHGVSATFEEAESGERVVGRQLVPRRPPRVQDSSKWTDNEH